MAYLGGTYSFFFLCTKSSLVDIRVLLFHYCYRPPRTSYLIFNKDLGTATTEACQGKQLRVPLVIPYKQSIHFLLGQTFLTY